MYVKTLYTYEKMTSQSIIVVISLIGKTYYIWSDLVTFIVAIYQKNSVELDIYRHILCEVSIQEIRFNTRSIIWIYKHGKFIKTYSCR